MPIFKLGEFVKGKTKSFIICENKNLNAAICKYCAFHIDNDFDCDIRRKNELNTSQSCDVLIGKNNHFEELKGGL